MKSKFGSKLISGAGLGALAALIVYLLSGYILPFTPRLLYESLLLIECSLFFLSSARDEFNQLYFILCNL